MIVVGALMMEVCSSLTALLKSVATSQKRRALVPRRISSREMMFQSVTH